LAHDIRPKPFRSLHREDHLEDLVQRQKPFEFLPPDVLRKILQLDLDRVGAGVENPFDIRADLLLGSSAELLHQVWVT
jgi:hypothetical protein